MDREVYEEFLEAGLCPWCGNIANNGVLCDSCAARKNERLAAAREKRRSHGLCPLCGGKPAAGMTLCRRHLKLSRQANARLRESGAATENARNRYALYREHGLCGICGETPAKGRALCAKHLEERRQAAEERRRAAKMGRQP